MPSGYTYDENELLAQVAAGDRQAFTQAYRLTYPQLYYFAKRYVNEETARDVVAETYARLLKQPRSFGNVGHMLSYLRSMVRNACIDLLNREKREYTVQEELHYLSEAAYDSTLREQDEIKAALYKMVLDEIEKLPPLPRSIFKLSYLEGKSNAEIADLLNIKDKTVRNKKAEALRSIRIGLGQFSFLLLIFSKISRF